MYCSRPFRRLAIALIPAAALSLGLSAVLAQTPPATPPGATAPATPAPPDAPTPPGTVTPATPTPPPAEVQTPANP
ncbi:MAG: AraC family transcriptional regulator, partial [Nitrobacter sp.]